MAKRMLMSAAASDPQSTVHHGHLMRSPLRRDDSPERSADNKELLASRCKTAWSRRELEWFTAEKRLLFSAKNTTEAIKWITVIRWAKRELLKTL